MVQEPPPPETPSSVSITVVATTTSPRVQVTNRRILLLLLWIGAIFTPWFLQLRSFVNLVTPHKISQDLIVQSLDPIVTNLTAECPVRGLRIANIWWNLVPTHYYIKSTGKICHFVIPQYNMHGNYHIGDIIAVPNRVKCATQVRAISYYFYHGSVGYLAFYEEGKGEVCTKDMQADMKVGKLGSADMNGRALAIDQGEDDYRLSVYFLVYGIVWLSFRALVLRRSFILFLRYIDRRLNHGDRIHTHDAVVYIQESARLTAHDARNWQRVAILYFLLEGLMADLYQMVTTEGIRGIIQALSLGYNLASILSVLFEILESTVRVPKRLRMLKRLLFNHESTIVGECACAFAIQFFLTITNKSKVADTMAEAHAVSYYLWGLIGHLVPVSMIIILLLLIRTIGSMSLVLWTYGSLSLLSAPCVVDDAMGTRQRLAVAGGYRVRNNELYFSRRMLRMYGLMQSISEGAITYLVQEKVYWFTAPPRGFVAIGVITGSRVESCHERQILADVVFCDHVLGGVDSSEGRRVSIQVSPRALSHRKYAQ